MTDFRLSTPTFSALAICITNPIPHFVARHFSSFNTQKSISPYTCTYQLTAPIHNVNTVQIITSATTLNTLTKYRQRRTETHRRLAAAQFSRPILRSNSQQPVPHPNRQARSTSQNSRPLSAIRVSHQNRCANTRRKSTFSFWLTPLRLRRERRATSSTKGKSHIHRRRSRTAQAR